MAARELEGLTVNSPKDNPEDNIDMSEPEDHQDSEVSKKEADEDEAETEVPEMKSEVLEKDVEAEDNINTHTILKSEAEETINTLTRENVEYKVENEALKYEIAKLKEELSKK